MMLLAVSLPADFSQVNLCHFFQVLQVKITGLTELSSDLAPQRL